MPLVADPYVLELFLQKLLTLFGPFREIKNDLPTNTPGELPNLLGNPPLFITSLPYYSNELLHSHSHDHILVIDGVFD